MELKKKPEAHAYHAADEEVFNSYLQQVMAEVRLPRKEMKLFEADLRSAADYFLSTSMPMQEALARMGTDIFGSFYVQPDPDEWYPLDNAAKIYPLSMTRSNMSVYRISAVLNEELVPEILQIALHAVIKRFPTFATTLKQGIFWHYLDARRKRFVIEKEAYEPCAPIKLNTNRDQVFRIVYFDKRVSIEVFHGVADGYGGMTFFKTLLAEYLRLMGAPKAEADDILDITAAPSAEESVNAFTLTDTADKTTGYGNANALQISGKRTRRQPAQLLHFIMDSEAVVKTAKELHTNMTGFMLAAMFTALKAASKEKQGMFQIQLPVNMRQHYPVRTLRNFSMYAIIKIPSGEADSLETLIPKINEQLRTGTGKESLDRMATMTNKLVGSRMLKLTPVVVKGIIISRIIDHINRKSFSATLSNMGAVKTDFFGRINRFEAVLGPRGSNEVGCGLISFQQNTVLSITKPTTDNAFETKLQEVFTSLGLKITIEGNNP